MFKEERFAIFWEVIAKPGNIQLPHYTLLLIPAWLSQAIELWQVEHILIYK